LLPGAIANGGLGTKSACMNAIVPVARMRTASNLTRHDSPGARSKV